MQRIQWIPFADFDTGAATLRQQLRRIAGSDARRSSAVTPDRNHLKAKAASPVVGERVSSKPSCALSETSDVYICYDQSDAALAQRLRGIFAARGLRSTLAEQRPAAPDFAAEGADIRCFDENSRAAAGATVFCFVLSRESITSDACGEEFHAAYELDKLMMAATDAALGAVPALLNERGSMAMMLESSMTAGDMVAFGQAPPLHAEYAAAAVAFKLLAQASASSGNGPERVALSVKTKKGGGNKHGTGRRSLKLKRAKTDAGRLSGGSDRNLLQESGPSAPARSPQTAQAKN